METGYWTGNFPGPQKLNVSGQEIPKKMTMNPTLSPLRVFRGVNINTNLWRVWTCLSLEGVESAQQM